MFGPGMGEAWWESSVGVCRALEFRRGLLWNCEGWMDTGGARECAALTGDVGLPPNRGSRHADSLRRGGNCWERPVAGVVLLLPRCDALESCGLAEDAVRK